MGVFNQIISKLAEGEGQINILNGFNSALAENSNLFYPSSQVDINDLLYIKPNRIKLACPFPKVYIHCDKLATHDYGVIFDTKLSFTFEILGVFKRTDLVEKSCNIYKLKNRIIPSSTTRVMSLTLISLLPSFCNKSNILDH